MLSRHQSLEHKTEESENRFIKVKVRTKSIPAQIMNGETKLTRVCVKLQRLVKLNLTEILQANKGVVSCPVKQKSPVYIQRKGSKREGKKESKRAQTDFYVNVD